MSDDGMLHLPNAPNQSAMFGTLRQQKSRWIDAPSHPCLYYCCLGAQDEDGCSGEPSFYYWCHPCPTAYWRAVKWQSCSKYTFREYYFHNATTDEKTWTPPAVFIDPDGKKRVVGTIWRHEEDGEPMSAFEKAIACAQFTFVFLSCVYSVVSVVAVVVAVAVAVVVEDDKKSLVSNFVIYLKSLCVAPPP